MSKEDVQATLEGAGAGDGGKGAGDSPAPASGGSGGAGGGKGTGKGKGGGKGGGKRPPPSGGGSDGEDGGMFEVRADGVYRRYWRDGSERWAWVCSPVEVIAKTRTGEGEDWGRLLRVIDDDGEPHEWAMPCEMLAGDGGEYRRRLLGMGARIAAGKTGRERLHEYLGEASPDMRARCVDRIGWHGGRFILPGDSMTGTEGEAVVFQTAGRSGGYAYNVAGGVDEWRANVSALASGNSRLLLALSAAFAGPLMELTGDEGGGFHLRGGSSTGKSTALVAAGSVWGGGPKGYMRQWRATDNALEGVALAHNDALLCLDELSQIHAGAAGQAAYMLSNGVGKARQAAGGGAREVASWRVLFLSNGEIGLADKIAEGGGRAAAGMAVRIVDIGADAGAGLGLFEALHGSENAAAFAQRVKAAARVSYGAVGRAYIEALESDLDGIGERVGVLRRAFLKDVARPDMDGQVLRVLDRFALVGAAGELAQALGLVAWKEGEALGAAARCFGDWIKDRGGVGSAEEAEAMERVRAFIAEHGEARFTPFDGVRPNRPTMKRAGYVKLVDGMGEPIEPQYYVDPSMWRGEILAGLDMRTMNAALAMAGVLPDGASAKAVHVPAEKGARRLYRISQAFLRGGEDAKG